MNAQIAAFGLGTLTGRAGFAGDTCQFTGSIDIKLT
jgi:hypothetical protein